MYSTVPPAMDSSTFRFQRWSPATAAMAISSGAPWGAGSQEMLRRQYEAVVRYRACVAGMPSKDTVKLVDDDNYAVKTPERKYVWTVQTPQVFENSLIMDAYSMMMGEDCEGITDDAMAVERYMHVPVKLVEGSYRNIKITTPEDMEVAHAFLNGKN